VTDAGLGPRRSRRILLLIGPAGAGKGTQAARLSQILGLPAIATGDLFRAAVREGTQLGRQADAYMQRGELVPDEITVALVAQQLESPATARGLILDGFPRTVPQARALDAMLAERGEVVERALYIEVPTEELVDRLAGRLVCPTCGTLYHAGRNPPREPGICDRDGSTLTARADDRPDVVRARLRGQLAPMLEVVAHYEELGHLRRIDGGQPIGVVSTALQRAVEPS